jgi:hypothetical protein
MQNLRENPKSFMDGVSNVVDVHKEQSANKIMQAIGLVDAEPDSPDAKILSEWKGGINDAVTRNAIIGSNLIDIGKSISGVVSNEAVHLVASGHPLPTAAGQLARMIGDLPETFGVQVSKFVGEKLSSLTPEEIKQYVDTQKAPEGWVENVGKSLGIPFLSGVQSDKQQAVEKFLSEEIKQQTSGAVETDYQPKYPSGQVAAMATTFIPLLAGGEGAILQKALTLGGSTVTPVVLAELVKENGGSKSTQDLISTLGMFGGGAAGHFTPAIIDRITNPPLHPELAKAIDNGVFPNATPEAKAEASQIVRATTPQEASGAYAKEDELAKPTLAAAMKEINPQVHSEYTALTDRKNLLKTGLDNLKEQQRTDVEAAAPHADEIADLQAKLEDANPRKAKIYQAKIDALTAERERYIEENTKGDTPEMADLRSKHQELDYRQRDLAPAISEMRRQAIEQNPHLEEYTPKASFAEEKPVVAEKPIEAKAVVQNKVPEEGNKVTPPKLDIAADVAKNIGDVGRPAEEANAIGKLVAEHYKAISEQGWTKGTAEEIYAREAPEITKGKNKVNKGELEQPAKGKIRLATEQAKAAIKIFGKSDASTAIHEIGHAWLDELMRFSKDESAPEALKAHADKVREWLGDKTGEYSGFSRGQHEQFARGFERYMREGVAPSKELANVFAKFKDWLSRIYQTVQDLRSPITDDIRNVFDHMLSANPEKAVIEPEVKVEKTAPEPKPLKPHETLVKPRNTQLAIPVPKEPDSLAEFVRKNGGLRDGGGDVLKVLDTKLRKDGTAGRGLVNKSGLEHEAMAEKAHEAGYFPEINDRLPTEKEFQAALEDDLAGNKRYSHNDIEKVQDYHDAIRHNEEIDRLATELGIDTKGKTYEQFWEEAAEKMSKNEQEEFNLAKEQEAQDLLERMNGSLEDGNYQEELATIEPRSIEDLENERKQEELAANAGQSETNTTNTEHPAGSEATGGTSDRQNGAGVEPTGRTGEEGAAAERGRNGTGNAEREFTAGSKDPSDINSIVKKPVPYLMPSGDVNYDMIQKRIEKLETSQEIQDFIQEVAKEMDNFKQARRGVVTNADTMRLAEAIGVDELGDRKIGETYNAHQLKAAEAIFHTLSADAYNKSLLAKTPENIIEYKIAQQKMVDAANNFLGAVSETGRALQILTTVREGIKGAQNIAELFQKQTGETLDDIAQQMNMLAALKDPVQKAKFLRDTAKSSVKDILQEIYVNNLISGPITHIRYAVQNALKSIYTPIIEIPLSALASAAISALGKDVEKVYFGESLEQLYAIGKGSADGWTALTRAVKGGQPIDLMKLSEGFNVSQAGAYYPHVNAIKGKFGEIYNIPSRVVTGIHNFSAVLRYEQEIAGNAYRTAQNPSFINDIVKNTISPTAEMMKNARERALKDMYMSQTDYNSIESKLSRISSHNIVARMAMPFAKIGIGITKGFMELTPGLNFIDKTSRDNLLGRNGDIAQARQLGAMLLGISTIWAVQHFASQGLITGNGPDDPEKRKVWLLTNTPYTVKIGGLQIPYKGSPVGMLMGMTADMSETAHAWDDGDGEKLAMMQLGNFGRNITDETFLNGLHTMIDALTKPQQSASELASLVTNWSPWAIGQSQINNMLDPVVREHHGIIQAAYNKIPFLEETLMPKISVFGDPVTRKADIEKYHNDPVTMQLQELHIGIANPEREINKIKLDDKQYMDFSVYRGHILHNGLSTLIQGDGAEDFNSANTEQKLAIIKGVEEFATHSAKNAMFFHYPDLMKKAADKAADENDVDYNQLLRKQTKIINKTTSQVQ